MGGALTALEPDLTQSVLNVVGMNYSTLLTRSTDSGQYLDIANLGLWANYPGLERRPLILSLMQLLWDRGEANGYAHHMTDDPLPNTPEHHVLLQLGYGDHQVSNVAGEVEARTIGAQVHTPELDPGRHWGTDPLFGLTPIGGLPLQRARRRWSITTAGRSTSPARRTRRARMRTRTRCTGPLRRRWSTCRRTRSASTAAIRTSTRGARSTAWGTMLTWLQNDGFIDQCLDGSDPRPCYSNGYAGP